MTAILATKLVFFKKKYEGEIKYGQKDFYSDAMVRLFLLLSSWKNLLKLGQNNYSGPQHFQIWHFYYLTS